MRPYKTAATEAHRIRIKEINERLDELNLSRYALSQRTGISQGQLKRILELETVPATTVMLEIYGALNLRQYIVPSEMDDNEVKRIFFN